MPEGRSHDCPRPLAQGPDDVRPLHVMCREGRLYEVEGWIADGKPSPTEWVLPSA